jgi:MFS family permease
VSEKISALTLSYFLLCWNMLSVCLGWVVSSTLAGATVGSFTGGSLADKIGCRRTFQLDAIPLLIGTLLRYLLYSSYSLASPSHGSSWQWS